MLTKLKSERVDVLLEKTVNDVKEWLERLCLGPSIFKHMVRTYVVGTYPAVEVEFEFMKFHKDRWIRGGGTFRRIIPPPPFGIDPVKVSNIVARQLVHTVSSFMEKYPDSGPC